MVDTLVVTEKYVINSLKPSDPFIYRLLHVVDDYYLASASYYFNIKGAENSYEGYFKITKRADNDSIMFRSGLNERTSEQLYRKLIDGMEVYYSVIQIDVQDIVYNGSILPDCIVYDDTNSVTHKMSVKAPDNTDYYIDSYIISKKYGLLSYKLKSGETFTRVADEAR